MCELLKSSGLLQKILPQIKKEVEEFVALYELEWIRLEQRGGFELCRAATPNLKHADALILHTILTQCDSEAIDSVERWSRHDPLQIDGMFKSYVTGSHTRSIYLAAQELEYRVEYEGPKFTAHINMPSGGTVLVTDLRVSKQFRDWTAYQWPSRLIRVV